MILHKKLNRRLDDLEKMYNKLSNKYSSLKWLVDNPQKFKYGDKVHWIDKDKGTIYGTVKNEGKVNFLGGFWNFHDWNFHDGSINEYERIYTVDTENQLQEKSERVLNKDK